MPSLCKPLRRIAGLALIAWAGTLLAAAGARAQEIPVAFIAPLSGVPATPDAVALRTGIEAHFAQINAQGGINGRRLALVTYDDHYDPAEFARQLDLAMRRKPVAVLSPIGLGAFGALAGGKLLDRHDTVVVNVAPGATALRKPGHERLFHVRASDRQQIEKILLHCQALRLHRIDVLIQDLRAGGEDVAEARRRLGAEVDVQVREVGVAPEAIRKAAALVGNTGTQAAVVLGAPPFMAQMAAELRKAGVSQLIFTLSYVQPQMVVQMAGGVQTARGVSITQTFPNPNGRTLPLHREFAAAMRTQSIAAGSFEPFQLEGYISARVLTEGLRRASAMTPAALAEALHRMGPVDLGGFWIDFSKGQSGSNFVDIAVIAPNGRLMY